MTNFGQRSDFKPLKLANCPISAERVFSIKIGSVADLKINKNLEIVDINKQHIDFILISIPSHWNWLFDCNPK
jgi:hypothetical protein